MTAKRRFRRVVLPTLWLAIGAVTATSLAVLAFGGGGDEDSDVLVPTATRPSDVVPAEIATVENSLVVDATVALDPAVDVPAPDAGTLVYAWARNGAAIGKGAPLYQLRIEGEASGAAEEGDEEAEPPAPRFVTVVAPASGRVSGFRAALGDDVEDAAVVARVASTRYTLRGTVTPLDRYRLLDLPRTAEVTIPGGPEPFECTGLRISDATSTAPATDGDEGDGGDPSLEGGSVEGGADAETGGASVTCRVPDRITVFDGLAADVEIDAGSAEDVLTVPVTAVQGLLERGAVWVVGDDGEPQRREVELGVSDGTVVEVRDGLEEGTEVLLYVPGSSPEESEDESFAY